MLPKKPEAGDSESSDHEYEVIDICRAKINNGNGDNFTRSISHPGPTEATSEKPQIELFRGTSVCEPLATKTNQNKGAAIRIRKQSAPPNAKKFSIDSSQAQLKDKKVRRSETTKEKVSARLGVARKESLLLLPDNAIHHPGTSIKTKNDTFSNSTSNQNQASFDNQAFDKSPDPSCIDNQKKKLTKNRSELLLQDESPDKDSNGLEDCIDQDNLGEKLSRLSSLTLSSLNSTFQLNKRRADYSTKKKYHSVDSESPTHNYDNVPLPIPFGKQDHPNGARPKNQTNSEEEGSSTDGSSGSSTSLTSPSSSSDSKRLSPQTQVQSLSEETSSLADESTGKLTNRDMRTSASFSEKSNSEKTKSMELQNIGAGDVERTISSSSEYSSDSDEDEDDTEDSESETSSEQDGEQGLEAKDVNIVDQFESARHPARKPSINKLGGISRAQILENFKNETTNGKKSYKDKDQSNDGGNNKPTDLSLAFIGCEDTDQFNQNTPLGNDQRE